jgi:dTDP-3-amino-3,4,6-trideoxy-alpha-D-glucose transaminase
MFLMAETGYDCMKAYTFIPAAAPKLRIERFRREVESAMCSVVNSGKWILGTETEAFEQEFANYLGASHCVGVGSGTDAITLALRALGIGEGDEVITVSMTAAGTAVGIVQSGADIRFVDVEYSTRGMNPDEVEFAINARTAAIVAVHLHGIPVAIERLQAIARRHRLALVEDCAQAHGATVNGRCVGTFGDAAAFSFYPTKNLGGIGDGGAVIVRDHAVAEKIRRSRHYGWSSDRIAVQWGINSRLDELQAAILRTLLPHLNATNNERRDIARSYLAALSGSSADLPPWNDGAIYHQFAIALTDRDAVADALSMRGIQTAMHYPVGLHNQPQFYKEGISLPVTDTLSKKLLSVPIQPEIVQPYLELITSALREEIR